MSRKANPITIGLFVSGAFVLLTGLVVFFGTAQFYEKTEKFILFFDESVNGLSVGSAVKFKGVPVGQVTRIMIRAENQPLSSSAIPVVVELDESRLERDLNVGIDISDREDFAQQINNGLRARLNTESLITGLLFIELDYIEDAEKPVIVQDTFVYKEIPTVPSTVQALTEQMRRAIGVLSEADLAGTLETIQKTIRLAHTRLEELDVPRLVNSFTETSDSISGFLDSTDVSETLNKLDRALVQLNKTLVAVEGETTVLKEDLTATLEKVGTLVEESSELIQGVDSAYGADSPVIYELETTLQSVSEAADAIRRLADFIERNPNAILSGRSSN